MNIIKVKAEGQKIRFISLPKITSGNKKIDKILVEFDESWDPENTNIFIKIHNNNKSFLITPKRYETGLIYSIPNYFINFNGRVYIGLVGKKKGCIVKTTNEIYFNVETGPSYSCTSYYIDVDEFISDIIYILNYKYDFNLDENSTTNDILDALNSLIINYDDRSFFINLLNRELDLNLKVSDSNESITNTVEESIGSLNEIKENYNYLLNGLVEVINSD